MPRACRYCWRWTKSSGASSTWPARSPWRARPSCQVRMRRDWPTADTAWSTAGSVGRAPPRPRADQPAAMAPEVTTTTRRPSPSARGGDLVARAVRHRRYRGVRLDTTPAPASGRRVGRAPTLARAGQSRHARYQVKDTPPTVHLVAVAGAGPGQQAVHPQPAEAPDGLGEGPVVGQVRRRPRPARPPGPTTPTRPASTRSTRTPSGTGRWTTTSPGVHRLGLPGPPSPGGQSRRSSSATPRPVAAEIGQRRPAAPSGAGHVRLGPHDQARAGRAARAGSGPARRSEHASCSAGGASRTPGRAARSSTRPARRGAGSGGRGRAPRPPPRPGRGCRP